MILKKLEKKFPKNIYIFELLLYLLFESYSTKSGTAHKYLYSWTAPKTGYI